MYFVLEGRGALDLPVVAADAARHILGEGTRHGCTAMSLLQYIGAQIVGAQIVIRAARVLHARLCYQKEARGVTHVR